MSKVTSKLQVTVPKVIADRYGIVPGAQIEWEPAGDAIRVVPPGAERPVDDPAERLRLFDQQTRRQAAREAAAGGKPQRARDRGWTRESLYRRGSRGRAD